LWLSRFQAYLERTLRDLLEWNTAIEEYAAVSHAVKNLLVQRHTTEAETLEILKERKADQKTIARVESVLAQTNRGIAQVDAFDAKLRASRAAAFHRNVGDDARLYAAEDLFGQAVLKGFRSKECFTGYFCDHCLSTNKHIDAGLIRHISEHTVFPLCFFADRIEKMNRRDKVAAGVIESRMLNDEKSGSNAVMLWILRISHQSFVTGLNIRNKTIRYVVVKESSDKKYPATGLLPLTTNWLKEREIDPDTQEPVVEDLCGKCRLASVRVATCEHSERAEYNENKLNGKLFEVTTVQCDASEVTGTDEDSFKVQMGGVSHEHRLKTLLDILSEKNKQLQKHTLMDAFRAAKLNVREFYAALFALYVRLDIIATAASAVLASASASSSLSNSIQSLSLSASSSAAKPAEPKPAPKSSAESYLDELFARPAFASSSSSSSSSSSLKSLIAAVPVTSAPKTTAVVAKGIPNPLASTSKPATTAPAPKKSAMKEFPVDSWPLTGVLTSVKAQPVPESISNITVIALAQLMRKANIGAVMRKHAK